MNKKRLLQTIGLATKRGAGERGRYLREKNILASVGENVHFQPRLVPLYPELIKLHNNIMVSAGIRFITHDASFVVLNRLGQGQFPEEVGCIEVMDNNVYIGYNATIMPNVKIGENVIVGAGALVSNDLEPNGVYVGIPAKKICSFDDYVNRHREISAGGCTPFLMWIITSIFQKMKLRKPGSFSRMKGYKTDSWSTLFIQREGNMIDV